MNARTSTKQEIRITNLSKYSSGSLGSVLQVHKHRYSYKLKQNSAPTNLCRKRELINLTNPPVLQKTHFWLIHRQTFSTNIIATVVSLFRVCFLLSLLNAALIYKILLHFCFLLKKRTRGCRVYTHTIARFIRLFSSVQLCI